MTTTEQVLTAALGLAEEARFEIIEALIESVQPPDQPPFDDSWREVIRQRSADLAAGRVTTIPWSKVKRQARDAVGG